MVVRDGMEVGLFKVSRIDQSVAAEDIRCNITREHRFTCEIP